MKATLGRVIHAILFVSLLLAIMYDIAVAVFIVKCSVAISSLGAMIFLFSGEKEWRRIYAEYGDVSRLAGGAYWLLFAVILLNAGYVIYSALATLSAIVSIFTTVWCKYKL